MSTLENFYYQKIINFMPNVNKEIKKLFKEGDIAIKILKREMPKLKEEQKELSNISASTKKSRPKVSKPEGLNVLSLFDGISCGQFSLRSGGHKIAKYYASEIDQHAIKVTMKNFPDTIQLGDVTKIKLDELPKIDVLIGGSPCQGFSSSGKGLAFDDPRSKLFFEYVKIFRALRKRNPKLKFLLENVVMAKQHMNVITKHLEVEPVFIDSRVFSAQSRKRLYWTNIPLSPLPEQSKLVLWDIVEKPYFAGDVFKLNLFEYKDNSKSNYTWKQNRKVNTLNGKCPTITKSCNPVNIPITSIKSRKAFPIELERLAGLPENYTDNVSTRQRLSAIGNGWECNTIKFLFKNL